MSETTVPFTAKQLEEAIGHMKYFREKGDQKLTSMQAQVDAIDLRMKTGERGFHGDFTRDSLNTKKLFDENESLQRLIRDRKGNAIIHLKGSDAAQFFERKTTITSAAVGAATSGVLSIERLQNITGEARRKLMIRDVLTASPTTFQLIDFVKIATPASIASPAPEGTLKAENAMTFATASERVKTIATWIPGAKQLLDDMPDLLSFIRGTLGYYVDLAEELQLLTGDGTGENLHGLIPQASNFNAGLLSATRGWNAIDVIGWAQAQIAAANEIPATFVVLSSLDWAKIRLTKDGFGRYILGDPQMNVEPTIFNLRVVPSNSMSVGTFLVGSGDPAAAEIKDRMEMQIDISTEHADFFTRNLVAIRAEKRLALVVRRPGSFVYGNLNSSPAY